MNHPGDIYRQEFERRIFVPNPKSVLDVGFGDGTFLRKVTERGIQATGVDTNEDKVAAARTSGLSVSHAAADSLPYPDMSFDCVVAERVVHHYADLKASLTEMLRVTRFDTYILDPWYDETVPSQASAAALDRWFKSVDRAQGGINHGPLCAQDFLAALPNSVQFAIDITHRLALCPVSIDEEIATEYSAYLDKIENPLAFRRELEGLIAQARRTGLTREGAIFVELKRL